MKKILAIISLMLVTVLLFASCVGGNNDADVTTTAAPEESTAYVQPEIKIGLLKGPTGMGAAQLLENNSLGTSAAKYTVNLASAPDVLQSALISGELDIAALPTNVAAVLNGKTEGNVQILAVNTLGVIYLMDNSDTVKSITDLKGKTILSAGKGTTTEYVLNYILSKNGLTVGTDVTVEYASEHAEVITKAVAGDYSVVLLPEPFVTQMKGQNAGFVTAIDLTAEWKKLDAGELTMGCIAVRKDFADENPQAVAAFLSDYSASVEYVNANTEAAADLIEKYEIAKAQIAKAALPNCNITCITGEEMKTAVSAYLTVLFNENEKSVGGAMPGDSFYAMPVSAE